VSSWYGREGGEARGGGAPPPPPLQLVSASSNPLEGGCSLSGPDLVALADAALLHAEVGDDTAVRVIVGVKDEALERLLRAPSTGLEISAAAQRPR
jgi:hypothetical protein